jgi:lipopolysaccharide/colanic/teichoic acid biosynthesis glycosyltransferase
MDFAQTANLPDLTAGVRPSAGPTAVVPGPNPDVFMQVSVPIARTTTTTRRSFLHRLRSKQCIKGGVAIFTGYDYFLQKRDLQRLLGQYRELVFIPRQNEDDALLQRTVRSLLHAYETIHLVTNPDYDRRYRIVYELMVRSSKSIRVSTVEDFCRRELRKEYVPETTEDFNVELLVLPTFGRRVQWFKRAFDVGIAGTLLALTSPLWLLSHLRIRRQSPGPVLFRQSRVGYQEQDFVCIKFRSMRLDAEALGATFSRKRDRRTFPYGAFMRATRIDELPQLLNVLRGDISLIGPRPERRVFTESFEEIIPHYSQRHVVKPGITGYAQIRYGYGAGARDARHKLMYDLYYIKHWSPALEFSILWQTGWSVISKRGR